MSDREIPDSRELTKIGWSVFKILGIWFLFWLLSHCLAHADVTANLGFNWADGYHDAIEGQSVTDTVTCGWPANMTLEVPGYGSFAGGSTFTIGPTGFGAGDMTANNGNGGATASYTATVVYQGMQVGQCTLNLVETGWSGNYSWSPPPPLTVSDVLNANINGLLGTATVSMNTVNSDTSPHTVSFIYNGATIDSEPVPQGNGNFSWTKQGAQSGDTWQILVDGQVWASGTVSLGEGTTYTYFAGTDTWAAPSPTPTPSPSPSPSPSASPSPSPSPSASPTPTPDDSPTPTPNPSPSPGESPTPGPTPDQSPTPTPTPGESPTPSPSPSASPTPSPSASPSPGSDGGLTEKDIETAIRNTFGDTSGAPQANQSDFSYTDDLTIPADTTSPALSSVSTQLAGVQNVFGGLAPDWRSLVSNLTPLYFFTLDFSGFGLGVVTINLAPFATGISWVRALILASITMIIIIKLAKHVGTVL